MIRFRDYFIYRVAIHRSIVGVIRSLSRLVLLVAWMGVTFFAFCIVSLYSRRRRMSERRRVLEILAKGLVEISGGSIEVEGTIPRRPFYLVSNHVSWLDIVVYQVVTGCVFVSKSDVAQWPVIGTIARNTGALFIKRERLRELFSVNDQITHALSRGEGVLVFVESTTSAGDVILPFKSALLESAATGSVDVSFASIHYQSHERWPPASRVIGWGDWTPFFVHMMRFLRLPRYRATIRFGTKTYCASDRKRLAKQLESAVRGIHTIML